MRLIQIRLRHNQPFWFLDDQIRLTSRKPVSKLINIDSLDEEYRKVINQSVQDCAILLFDSEGRRLRNLNEASVIEGDLAVSAADIIEDPVPEVASVTVSDEPEEAPQEEEAPDYSEEAAILLKKNGNTVKKTILSLPKDDNSLYFLHALLEVEAGDKGRRGVTVAIENAIGEY
jgi:hypothetical protein